MSHYSIGLYEIPRETFLKLYSPVCSFEARGETYSCGKIVVDKLNASVQYKK